MSIEHALEVRRKIKTLKEYIGLTKERQKSLKEELWRVKIFLTYTNPPEGFREWFLGRKSELEQILNLLEQALDIGSQKLTNLKNQLRIYSLS